MNVGEALTIIHCASLIPNIKVAGLALTESQVTASCDYDHMTHPRLSALYTAQKFLMVGFNNKRTLIIVHEKYTNCFSYPQFLPR
jgi:hypothetical protein